MDHRGSPARSDRRPAELLDRLLHEEGDRLRRHALFHSERRQDAEDALGDACVQFLVHFEGERIEEARRWMLTVIRHCAWAIGRKRRNRAAIVEEVAGDRAGGEDRRDVADRSRGPEDLMLASEDVAVFADAFSRMGSDERLALTLLAHGYSYREIERISGWSGRKVKRSVAEGRRRLRGSLPSAGGNF